MSLDKSKPESPQKKVLCLRGRSPAEVAVGLSQLKKLPEHVIIKQHTDLV